MTRNFTESAPVAVPISKTLSEADFASLVVELAIIRGWRYAHFLPAQRSGRWMTAMDGHIGFPDYVFARNGQVLFRELKTQHGRVTPGQKGWGAHLGELFKIWRPSDWADIQLELRWVPAAELLSLSSLLSLLPSPTREDQSRVVELAILRGWTYAHFLPAQRGGRWLTAGRSALRRQIDLRKAK